MAKKRGSKKKKQDIEKLFLENLLLLEKTLAELVTSFKKLEAKLTKLLNVFEKAAEAISEAGEEKKVKETITEKKKEEKVTKTTKPTKAASDELASKLELLIEQNKAIAEGLMLLEKFIKEKLEEKE